MNADFTRPDPTPPSPRASTTGRPPRYLTVAAGNCGGGGGNDATLTVLSGASLRATNDLTSAGAGAISGPGRCVNQGVVRRDTGTGGFSFSVSEFINERPLVLKSGRVSAAVDFRQTADGTLAVDLAARVGPFAVGGDASLDGLLELRFADGFLPWLGDTFELMTFGTRSGTFALSAAGEAARADYTHALHYGDHRLDVDITGVAATIPEPATHTLLAAGLALLAGMKRRPRR